MVQSCQDVPELIRKAPISESNLSKKDSSGKSKIRTDESLLKYVNLLDSRSSTGCDFDIYENPNLVDCSNYSATLAYDYDLCVYFTYYITRCYNLATGVYYFQIKDLVWTPLNPTGCPQKTYKGYSINYPGSNPSTHFTENNYIIVNLLKQIEQNHIYADLLVNTTGVGNIQTSIKKYCYAYCPSTSRYERCGEGCCIRTTWYEAVNGVAITQFSQVANLGCPKVVPLPLNCTNPGGVPPNCSESSGCVGLDNND